MAAEINPLQFIGVTKLDSDALLEKLAAVSS